MRSTVKNVLIALSLVGVLTFAAWEELFLFDQDGTVRIVPSQSELTTAFDWDLPERGVDYFLNLLKSKVECRCGELVEQSQIDADFGYNFGDLLRGLTGLAGDQSSFWSEACGTDLPVGNSPSGLVSFIPVRFDLPETCTYEYWLNNGVCSFDVELGVTGLDSIRVIIQHREGHHIPLVSVQCVGNLCTSFLRPCSSDEHCDGLVCSYVNPGENFLSGLSEVIGQFIGADDWTRADWGESSCPEIDGLGQSLLESIFEHFSPSLGGQASYVDGFGFCGLEDVTNVFTLEPFYDCTITDESTGESTTIGEALGESSPANIHAFAASIVTEDYGKFIEYGVDTDMEYGSESENSGGPFRISCPNIVSLENGVDNLNTYSALAPQTVENEGYLQLFHLSCSSQVSVLPHTPYQMFVQLPDFQDLLNSVSDEIEKIVECNQGAQVVDETLETRYWMHHLGPWLFLAEDLDINDLNPQAEDLFALLYEAVDSNVREGFGLSRISLPTSCTYDSWRSHGVCVLEYTGLGGLLDDEIIIRIIFSKCSSLPGAVPEILIDVNGAVVDEILGDLATEYCANDVCPVAGRECGAMPGSIPFDDATIPLVSGNFGGNYQDEILVIRGQVSDANNHNVYNIESDPSSYVYQLFIPEIATKLADCGITVDNDAWVFHGARFYDNYGYNCYESCEESCYEDPSCDGGYCCMNNCNNICDYDYSTSVRSGELYVSGGVDIASFEYEITTCLVSSPSDVYSYADASRAWAYVNCALGEQFDDDCEDPTILRSSCEDGNANEVDTVNFIYALRGQTPPVEYSDEEVTICMPVAASFAEAAESNGAEWGETQFAIDNDGTVLLNDLQGLNEESLANWPLGNGVAPAGLSDLIGTLSEENPEPTETTTNGDDDEDSAIVHGISFFTILAFTLFIFQ